jgi:hypothetical protein
LKIVFFHNPKTISFIAKNGKRKIAISTKIKTAAIIRRKKRQIGIRINLTTIPIPIEKITRPSLYSFLRGLKKVFIRVGIERRFAEYIKI